MAATLIDGKAIASDVRSDVTNGVREFHAASGRKPGLRVILVGNNPASESYVRGKERDAEEVGIDAETLRLPENTTEADLLEQLEALNTASEVDGILVQLPLPGQIEEATIIRAIDPDKDVDGFHPENVGKLVLGETTLLPCTPSGVIEMLQRSGVETEGARVVVVGRSNIVGKPMANLLIRYGIDATVTICHSRTRDLPRITRQADIVIAAVGRPEMISGDMLKPGATVIDVGISRVKDSSRERGYRLVGDVDFDSARKVAGAITPVPGGVGPMTRAMLLVNTLTAAKSRENGRFA